ncbi:MAG: hypothetical protein R3D84_03530 [Paracoccaceae bacterium]
MRTVEVFAQFFSPLTEALTDLRQLEVLLSDLGVDVELTEAHAEVVEGLLPLAFQLRQLTQQAEAMIADPEVQGEMDEGDVIDLVASVLDTVAALATTPTSSLQSLPGVLTDSQTWVRIARELPGYLLLTWLDNCLPLVPAVMGLGAAVVETPRPGGGAPRRVIAWDNLIALLRDPPAQIADTWNWGGDAFDADGFLKAVGLVVSAFGGAPRFVGPPAVLTDALGDRASPGAARVLDARLVTGGMAGQVGSVNLSGVGALSLMFTGVARPGADGVAGLAVMPVVAGAFTARSEIFDDVDLSLSATGAAAGGVGAALYPAGPEMILGQGAAEVSASLRLSSTPDTPWVLIGSETASHLRLERFAAAVSFVSDPPEVSVDLDLADALTLRIAAGRTPMA